MNLSSNLRPSLVRLAFLLSLTLLVTGCDPSAKRWKYQAGPMWVGYDAPSNLVRAKMSDMSWAKKEKRGRYLIRTVHRDLARVRPDLAITEPLRILGDGARLDPKTRLQAMRHVRQQLDDWENMVERHVKPDRDAQLAELRSLGLRAEKLIQNLQKRPEPEWKTLEAPIRELTAAVEKMRPESESDQQALLLTSLEYWAKIDMTKVKVEQPDLELECRLFTVPTRKDYHLYAVFPMVDDHVYFIEFHNVKENHLEDRVQPMLESVKIGLLEEEVVGDDLVSKLTSHLPKTDHKDRRKLFVLGFFFFSTVLPASISAMVNYPGQQVGEEERRELGHRVRRTVLWTSGLSVLGLGALVAAGAAADLGAGKLGLGAILLLLVGAAMLALFWGVTLLAAVGAGMGAERGSRSSRMLCVAGAGGGAVAGALAMLLLMAAGGL